MSKKPFVWLIAIIAMLVMLLLAACSADAVKASLADATRAQSGSSQVAEATTSGSENVSPALSASPTLAVPANASPAFDLSAVAPYAGKPSVEVNGNQPFFTDADFARGAFEEYSPLDRLGRCGVAFALVSRDTMPTEERGSIGMVKPSGWQTTRYDGLVEGNYLFNRCHLIGYLLTGENDNECNLITGTRALNTEGMLPFEERVASYVERTGNHVLYRATPCFEGDDLVARGVLLEAASVEDAGAGLHFCAWCYNIEPGVEIDYATGASHLTEEGEAVVAAAAAAAAAAEAAAAPEPAPEAVAEPAPAPEPAADANTRTYILNTNTHKFHYPDCSSVRDMAEHNKQTFEGSRDEAIGMGYAPCKRCNP